MDIRVRAFFKEGGPAAFGFDGMGRRRDGDEFDIDESKFDPSWMEKLDGKPAKVADTEGGDAPKAAPRKKSGAKK